MAFEKPYINHIKSDIRNLSIYLRTTKKFGKSTLFRDVVLEKFGDPSHGLAVACGKEHGETLLDNLNISHIQTYRDAIELKDWLIAEKGKEHQIELISFDTVDELTPIFEKETIRLSNLESPTKKVKTINAAMGGFQEGQRFTANELIKTYMDELHEAGFGIWALSHTKFKTIKEKGGTDEDGYMQLTSNMVAAYESAFGDIFDVTLTGVIDRNIEEKKDGEKTKRYATETLRKLYFRETPLIDAGGRFAFGAVPEFMVFDKPNMAKDFIKVIEDGMEKSKSNFVIPSNPNTNSSDLSPTASMQKLEQEEMNEKTEDNRYEDVIENESTEEYEDENTEENAAIEKNTERKESQNQSISPAEAEINTDELLNTIRSKFKTAEREVKVEIKKMLNGGTLDDGVPLETLHKILETLSQ